MMLLAMCFGGVEMTTKSQPRVVLLAQQGRSTRAIYHALADAFGVDAVVLEEGVSRRRFLSRRVKRLGLPTVLGQIAFMLGIVPLLKRISLQRVEQILALHEVQSTSIPPKVCHYVRSINDVRVEELLRSLKPDIIVISGTRIIAKKIIESVDAPFINMHAGITPAYRGVHGGYWSLYEGRPDLCGVTIHRVDEGIDTGRVLAQALIQPGSRDNFVTYPVLQLAVGIPLLVEAVERLFRDEASEVEPMTQRSKLWSHPTLKEYLWGLMRSVF